LSAHYAPFLYPGGDAASAEYLVDALFFGDTPVPNWNFVWLVAFQFYLIVRGRILRIHIKGYSDALPAFLFLVFRSRDFKQCLVQTRELDKEDLGGVLPERAVLLDSLADRARQFPFHTFFFFLARFVGLRQPELIPTDAVLEGLYGKRKRSSSSAHSDSALRMLTHCMVDKDNMHQCLVQLGFRELLWVGEPTSSVPIANARTKTVVYPKETSNCIPSFLCHATFRPGSPITTIHQALPFGVRHTLVEADRETAMQDENPSSSLPCSKMLMRWPLLHVDEIAIDQVRPEAWEWMAETGTVSALNLLEVAAPPPPETLTRWERFLWQLPFGPEHPSRLLRGLQLRLGNEADGVATLTRRYGCSYTQTAADHAICRAFLHEVFASFPTSVFSSGYDHFLQYVQEHATAECLDAFATRILCHPSANGVPMIRDLLASFVWEGRFPRSYLPPLADILVPPPPPPRTAPTEGGETVAAASLPLPPPPPTPPPSPPLPPAKKRRLAPSSSSSSSSSSSRPWGHVEGFLDRIKDGLASESVLEELRHAAHAPPLSTERKRQLRVLRELFCPIGSEPRRLLSQSAIVELPDNLVPLARFVEFDVLQYGMVRPATRERLEAMVVETAPSIDNAIELMHFLDRHASQFASSAILASPPLRASLAPSPAAPPSSSSSSSLLLLPSSLSLLPPPCSCPPSRSASPARALAPFSSSSSLFADGGGHFPPSRAPSPLNLT